MHKMEDQSSDRSDTGRTLDIELTTDTVEQSQRQRQRSDAGRTWAQTDHRPTTQKDQTKDGRAET